MARYKCEGHFKDGNGKAIVGGTGLVYLAGTTTLATIYAAATLTLSDTAISGSSVTSDANGKVIFYYDDFDYDSDQTFKIVLSTPSTLPSYSVTYDNLKGTPVLGAYTITGTKSVTTLVRIPKGVTYVKGTAGTITFTSQPIMGLYDVFTGFSAGEVVFPGGIQVGTVLTTAPDVTGTTKLGKVAVYDATNTLIGYVQIYQGPGS